MQNMGKWNNTTSRKIFFFYCCLPREFNGERPESKNCGEELCCHSRETKAERGSAGVGMLSTRLHVARGRESLEDIPQKHSIGEAS